MHAALACNRSAGQPKTGREHMPGQPRWCKEITQETKLNPKILVQLYCDCFLSNHQPHFQQASQNLQSEDGEKAHFVKCSPSHMKTSVWVPEHTCVVVSVMARWKSESSWFLGTNRPVTLAYLRSFRPRGPWFKQSVEDFQEEQLLRLSSDLCVSTHTFVSICTWM